jgi:hypothetical protein
VRVILDTNVFILKRSFTPRGAIEAVRAFRKGHALGGLSIREMIDEGRRS